MEIRNISKSVVEKILSSPEQIRTEDGKKVYQSIVENGNYLIRIFVNDLVDPNIVVTAYRTSEINKYYEG